MVDNVVELKYEQIVRYSTCETGIIHKMLIAVNTFKEVSVSGDYLKKSNT